MADKQEITLYLQRVTREIETIISSSSDRVVSALQALLTLSSDSKITTDLPSLLSDLNKQHVAFARDIFRQNHYTRVLEFLINHFTVEWLTALPKGQGVKLVEEIFLLGPPDQSLTVLGEAVSGRSSGYAMNKCIELVERLLRTRLQQLLWNQCQVCHPQDTDKQYRASLVTLIVSMPERVTARYSNQTSEFFYPDQYVPHLCDVVLAVLEQTHEAVCRENSCSLIFLAELLGKICLAGHKDMFWQRVLPELEDRVSRDAIWCRLCERLLSHIPDRCLESVVVPILSQATWYGTVVKFLGHSVLLNQKLHFLLTNKMIFVRHFTQVKILQNIFGYLSHSTATRHLLLKTLRLLLDVWGDASALRHTSYEQHLFISQAILVCLSFLTEADKPQLKTDLLPVLMTGMQCHLGSAVNSVRRLGMIVAESVTSSLDPNGEKLQFEYEDDEESKQLKQLLIKPTDPGPTRIMMSAAVEGLEKLRVKDEVTPDFQEQKSQMPDEELDSDDDLEPYDLSNDQKITKVKPPVYLRDCMEGLISSDDPDRLEVCLMAAESLIYSQPVSVREIAVEFTKLLLHLQDNYCLPGFLSARYKALIALTVTCPKPVSLYLTGEFYARNYNTRQRLDMLEVLAGAAQKLSNPADLPTPGSHRRDVLRPPTHLIQEVTSDDQKSETWKEIVQRRIESKTRRFVHGPQSAPLPEVPNKFAAVAGDFFFPLLAALDRRDGVVDLLGEDHMLLSRFIYTLGVIVYAAIHTTILRQMSKAMLEFVWAVRYHPQASVRQALLFALSMTLLAVPSHVLFTDLQAEIVDTKTWLQEVMEGDTDTDCRKLATQGLFLMDQALKQELDTKSAK